jgi:hypothetical protein
MPVPRARRARAIKAPANSAAVRTSPPPLASPHAPPTTVVRSRPHRCPNSPAAVPTGRSEADRAARLRSRRRHRLRRLRRVSRCAAAFVVPPAAAHHSSAFPPGCHRPSNRPRLRRLGIAGENRFPVCRVAASPSMCRSHVGVPKVTVGRSRAAAAPRALGMGERRTCASQRAGRGTGCLPAWAACSWAAA